MPTRTNIVLDDELIAQAMIRAGVTTKKAAVEAALKAFVREPDYSGFLALEGSDVLADDYDPDESYPYESPAQAQKSVGLMRLTKSTTSRGKRGKVKAGKGARTAIPA